MKHYFLLAGIAAMMLTACNQKTETTLTLSGLDPVKFQTTVNDAQTQLYTLKNKAGMEVCITNFGGTYCIHYGTRQKWSYAGCSIGL